MPHLAATPKLSHMKTVNVVGIIFNPLAPKAPGLARQIAGVIGSDRDSWMEPASSIDIADADLAQTDLIITVGGDGTILRAARVAALHDIPLLGVNLGRLGFMTELRARDALERIPQYLEGGARLEERSMLKAQVLCESSDSGSADSPWQNALNDVVLGRGSASRLIRVGKPSSTAPTSLPTVPTRLSSAVPPVPPAITFPPGGPSLTHELRRWC